MNDNQPKLPLATFWYGVTFFAGLYWGISFYSGAFGRAFALFVPPVICIGTAIVAAGGDRRRIILGAVTLYVNFLFTFGIGYALGSAGIVRFIYEKH
jgi:hypothetical protein